VDVRLVGVALATALIAVGCSSGSQEAGSQEASEASEEVSSYEISQELVPLLEAVTTYTNTDYSGSDDSPYTPEVYEAVKANFAAIDPVSQRWLTFSNSLDYGEVDVMGLESAVDSYNRAFTDWRDVQDDSMQVWDQCFAEGGDDLVVSMCLVTGVDVDAEQVVLTEYIDALTTLFEVLDIPVPSQ